MSFDAQWTEFARLWDALSLSMARAAADTSAACHTCGARCVPLVTHTGRVMTNVLTGAFRWVQWSSCRACDAGDQDRWNEQRRDEEREQAEAQERSKRAQERDAERAAKQRSSKQVSA